MAENQEQLDSTMQFLTGTAPFIMEQGMTPHVYANDTTNPVPYGLLDMFYRLVHENRVGMFIGKNAETGNEEIVLCFVGDKDDENAELFPVAVVLKAEDAGNYRAPVGDGSYFGDEDGSAEQA